MSAANGTWQGATEDVVLTGMSGRLPESNTIDEFAEKLFAGVDLVTADNRRWTSGMYDLPERGGKIKELSHFDASFFGVHSKQAHLMDPQLRMLLEVVHEAVVDAGVSPAELRGSRTGVYVGVSMSDTEEVLNMYDGKHTGYGILGCTRSMFANRITYSFDLRGPSYAIDTACSSSIYALAQATEAIKDGICDAAIVAGTNLCLTPSKSINFNKLRLLSPDGRCASFDASGNGYVRSEAVVAVFMQRREAARRVYCTVRGIGVNTDGYKEQSIMFPSGLVQQQLARETFAEAGLRPQDVAYVEAHGTGTQAGDPQEVNAIADLFCAGRSTPLLISSVKSNMGHSEPASGLCSIVKVVLAMERGQLSPNLHYTTPNPDIPALNDGRLQVVNSITPWEGGMVTVNSFGFGGANANVILESERGRLPRDNVTYYSIPRLICVSGRTEEAVHALLSLVMEEPRRAGLHALLDAVHAHHVHGHQHRGYVLLRDQPLTHVQEYESRPVWFVFSGMGSQYAGMAKQLMSLSTFSASINRCAATLKSYNIDLKTLLTDAPESAFDQVINCFVTITAMQVALVDVLREINLKPDGIIGHSMGEIGCAYADDALTAEQAVLCAYWRGKCVEEAELAPGAMAAVGLSWEEAVLQCPPDIVPACHNAVDNITISGPIPAITSFVEQLSAKGIFARVVKCGGYAFHSKHVAGAGPLLQQRLENIIEKPKLRSSNWVSSSLPKKQWDTEQAKFCSASYYVNNFLSPVRFSTALQELPEGALLIEIAPHALLKPLLRRTLPTAKIVGLLQRGRENQIEQLLCSIGEIYCDGAQPSISKLYPSISWPVCRGTPGLASKVKWDHSIQWDVANYETHQPKSGESISVIDLSDPENAYILGHNIDGRVIYPASGYLALVWRTMAKMNNKILSDTAVVLDDVHFVLATVMSNETPTKLYVSILEGSGKFIISEAGEVFVTGTVRIVNNSLDERVEEVSPTEKEFESVELPPITTKDIYKVLRLRGYHYEGEFKGIKKLYHCGNEGELAWNGNWLSFMDSIMQFYSIGVDTKGLCLPTKLQRVLINPTKQPEPGQNIPVRVHKDLEAIVAGGVELRGLKFNLVPSRLSFQQSLKLERHTFFSLCNPISNCVDPIQLKKDVITIFTQIIAENIKVQNLKVTEMALGRPVEALLTPIVMQTLKNEPLVQADISVFVDNPTDYVFLEKLGVKVVVTALDSCHCVIASGVLEIHGLDMLMTLVGVILHGGMLLLEETTSVIEKLEMKSILKKTGLRVVAQQHATTVVYLLLRKDMLIPRPSLVLEINEDYKWVQKLRDAMRAADEKDTRVYIWSKSAFSGILGLVTSLRGEIGSKALRVYYLPGSREAFSLDSSAYKKQVHMDLCMNVLKNNMWGTMRHLTLAESEVVLPVEHAYVNTVTRGTLASLKWIESPLRSETNVLTPNTKICNVYYAPLNKKDILIATGNLTSYKSLAKQEYNLGIEFSGLTSDGKQVMGIVEQRALATSVLVDEGLLWQIPDKWSLEQAATVPVAYATAYYALCVRGQIRRGMTVLIHAGSSDVGQAAITIAVHMECKVFTTVDSTDKGAFLLQRFSQLSKDNIGNSRNTSFEHLVRRRTGGRGVDLVLNLLTVDKLAASVRCLAVDGRFLELGSIDLIHRTVLGMSVFLKNIAFHGIVLDALLTADNPDKKAVLRCVADGIASGVVQPLPATIFGYSQLEQAFRFMAVNNHIGKVVMKIRSEEDTNKLSPVAQIPAVPRIYMNPSKSYVIVGGLEFVLELALWLVARGASQLVLSFVDVKDYVRSGYQDWLLRTWERAGLRVLVSTIDCNSSAGARALLQQAEQLGPVGGVFNLAAVLRDAFVEKQTPKEYRVVAQLKYDFTKELDVASRALCPVLDYFVTFSSMSCSPGNLETSNYRFANCTMERICETRQADGLPGLAIQWGAIEEIDHEKAGGTLVKNISPYFTALEKFLLNPNLVVVSVMPEELEITQYI